ncbi:hypothetical protein GIB67_033311, partial [Kingdonia uniflora]
AVGSFNQAWSSRKGSRHNNNNKSLSSNSSPSLQRLFRCQNKIEDINNDVETTTTQQSVSITLDNVNPVGLGRKSRQIFDQVWHNFSCLGQISRTNTDDTLEFTVPGAQNTTVLVVARSVNIVTGDVGEPLTLKYVVEGCNKIIYCATARSTITGDLNRVDHQGVYNISKAFQDYNNKLAQIQAGKSSKSKLLLSKFKSGESLQGWEVSEGTYFRM